MSKIFRTLYGHPYNIMSKNLISRLPYPIHNPNLALALAPISQLLVLNPLPISMKPARLRCPTHSIYPNGSHFSALMLTSNEA